MNTKKEEIQTGALKTDSILSKYILSFRSSKRLSEKKKKMENEIEKIDLMITQQRRLKDKSLFQFVEQIKSLSNDFSINDIASGIKIFWWDFLGNEEAGSIDPHFSKFLKIETKGVTESAKLKILEELGYTSDSA